MPTGHRRDRQPVRAVVGLLAYPSVSRLGIRVEVDRGLDRIPGVIEQVGGGGYVVRTMHGTFLSPGARFTLHLNQS